MKGGLQVIRVGIIGLGAIGQRLIKDFNNHPEVNIVSICDQIEERIIETAKQLNDILTFTDYTKMLEDTELDLVYVAVPPKYHHQVVSDVMEKGLNVLCEKPLANSTEEAESLFLKAKNKGIINAMNFPLNYSSGSNTFAALINDGYIGKVRRLELKMRFPQWPRAWQQNEWVASREQGGYVLEVGVHFIQQIQKIFGPVHVLNRIIQFPEDPKACETAILAHLETEDGTPLLIDGLSHIAGKEEIAFTAYGSEGTLSLLNWSALEGGKIGEEIVSIEADATLGDTLIGQLVKAIKGEEANIIDFSQGYEAQVVLEQLRK